MVSRRVSNDSCTFIDALFGDNKDPLRRLGAEGGLENKGK
jgi:hypothetical protein